jgi:1-deoxy-D-xylulose-5-phosphate synthase
LLDNAGRPQTYGDYFVETLVSKAEKDKDIVVVHAGFTMEPSLKLFRENFQIGFLIWELLSNTQ